MVDLARWIMWCHRFNRKHYYFPKIGSIETAVMPIIRMIVTSMLIDHFGWFHSTTLPFGLNRFIGVILILLGVIFAVVLRDFLMHRKLKKMSSDDINKYPWRAVGLLGGSMLAIQASHQRSTWCRCEFTINGCIFILLVVQSSYFVSGLYR